MSTSFFLSIACLFILIFLWNKLHYSQWDTAGRRTKTPSSNEPIRKAAAPTRPKPCPTAPSTDGFNTGSARFNGSSSTPLPYLRPTSPAIQNVQHNNTAHQPTTPTTGNWIFGSNRGPGYRDEPGEPRCKTCRNMDWGCFTHQLPNADCFIDIQLKDLQRAATATSGCPLCSFLWKATTALFGRRMAEFDNLRMLFFNTKLPGTRNKYRRRNFGPELGPWTGQLRKENRAATCVQFYMKEG